MRPTCLLPIGVILLGLSLDIVDLTTPHTTCSRSPPGAIDILCQVDYPGWLTVAGTAILLAGAVILFFTGTRRKESHVPPPDKNSSEWQVGAI